MIKFHQNDDKYDVMFMRGDTVIGSIWKSWTDAWVWSPSQDLATAFVTHLELRQIASKIDKLNRTNQ